MQSRNGQQWKTPIFKLQDGVAIGEAESSSLEQVRTSSVTGEIFRGLAAPKIGDPVF
jgi:hypothetical protein